MCLLNTLQKAALIYLQWTQYMSFYHVFIKDVQKVALIYVQWTQQMSSNHVFIKHNVKSSTYLCAMGTANVL